MAAGIVYHNMTTSSGVTFAVGGYVPDTGSPDALLLPTQLPINTAGSPAAFGSGANGATVLRVALATDSPGVTTLGQAAMAASLPVTMASDQSTIKTAEQGATSGGLTLLSTILANSTNATSVKGSPGQLYKVECFNNSATPAFLKIYNTAGTPTAGSGTPVWRMLIPGNATGTGVVSAYLPGLAFATGIGYTVTGLIADNDTTAVAATTFIVNLGYK